MHSTSSPLAVNGTTKLDKKVTPQAPQDVGAASHQLTFGPVEQPPLKIVSRSTRASNAARAALVVANVTPTGYRVGLFMATHARYAEPSDIRRNVVPGESSATGRRPRLQPRWAVVSGRSGAEFGPCAKRARSKSDGGYDRAKHRTFGFNPSGLTSGLTVQMMEFDVGLARHASYLTSGLASYQASGLIQNHVRNLRRTTLEAAAARAKSVRPADTPGRPKPNTGPRATNANHRHPQQGHRPPNRRPPNRRRRARAETATSKATGGGVWTARAGPAQRSSTLFDQRQRLLQSRRLRNTTGGCRRPQLSRVRTTLHRSPTPRRCYDFGKTPGRRGTRGRPMAQSHQSAASGPRGHDGGSRTAGGRGSSTPSGEHGGPSRRRPRLHNPRYPTHDRPTWPCAGARWDLSPGRDCHLRGSATA